MLKILVLYNVFHCYIGVFIICVFVDRLEGMLHMLKYVEYVLKGMLKGIK